MCLWNINDRWNTPLEEEDYEKLGIKKRKAKVDPLDDPDVPDDVKKRLKVMRDSGGGSGTKYV